MNHHTITFCAYKAEHIKSHHFSLLPSNFLLLHLLLATPFLLPKQWLMGLTRFLPSSSSPPSTTTRDREWFFDDVFFPNTAAAKMVDDTIPSMFDYWNKLMITEADRKAYHSFDWLTNGLESIVPIVECPMVVWFESHLIARLGLPPSKFLVAVMSFLRCELIHLNLNAIATLS
jgi:hypothetical protein